MLFPLTDFNLIVVVDSDSVASKTISLFPNPASSELNIIADDVIYEIQIVDMECKDITKFEEINSNYVLLDLTELVNRAYSAKILTETNTYNEKFIMNE